MGRFEEIWERCVAATPGPWTHDHMHGGEHVFNSLQEVNFVQRYGDASFIAHAREDIPYLLSEIERLKENCDRWEVTASGQQSLTCAVLADYEALTAELDEYRKARDEGRLVVLPCKVGDTVYSLLPGKEHVNEWVVDSVEYRKDKIGLLVHNKIYPGSTMAVTEKQIGDWIYLTREEAEAALNSSTERTVSFCPIKGHSPLCSVDECHEESKSGYERCKSALAAQKEGKRDDA